VLDNPYFFCENAVEFAWGEAAEEIGKGLHKAGKVKDPAPKTIPEELYPDVCVSTICLLVHADLELLAD